MGAAPFSHRHSASLLTHLRPPTTDTNAGAASPYFSIFEEMEKSHEANRGFLWAS
jgi:hypothetical protein